MRLTPGAEVEVSRDALRSLAERYRYMFAVGVLVSPELDAQRPAQPAHSDASWRAEKQAPGAKRRRRRRPGLIASVKTRKGVP